MKTTPVVINVNSTCDVLWVSRSSAYDLTALLGGPGTRPVTKAVRQFAAGGGRWLRNPRGSNVLQCSFSKDVDGAVGVWSMALKPTGKDQYDQFMRPGDLVFIYMASAQTFDQPDPASASTLVTVGIIDRVERTDAVDEKGAEVSMVAVNGRDLGVIFQETSTVFDPSFTAIEQQLFNSAYISATAERQDAISPIETVLNLIDILYTNKTNSKMFAAQWQLRLSNGTSVSLASLFDVTSFVQVPMFGYDVPDSIGLAQAGNIWDLLNGYTNRVINEFFFDVRDFTAAELRLIAYLESQNTPPVTSEADVQRQNKVIDRIISDKVFQAVAAAGNPDGDPVLALVYRQRPYDTDSFLQLPENQVDEKEVHEDNTARTYHDAYNFFRMRFPTLGDEWQEFNYGIPVRVDSVMKFGLRRLEAQSRYVFTSSELAANWDPSKKDDFSSTFDYYIGLLQTWYAANEDMLTGQIMLKHLRPDIRVGTRLRRTKTVNGVLKLYDYYVTGVSHQFSTDQGGSGTSLTVHRGVEVGGTGLVNNLIWRNGRSQIPPELNTFGKFSELVETTNNLEPESESADRIISDQIEGGG
jgi:hypothetical protein